MTTIPKLKPKTGFARWLFELDRILRGDATRPSSIQQADINIPVLGVACVVVCLAMAYGFCMGIFALVHGVENSLYQRALLQTFASMCKVPLLFVLTLVVTCRWCAISFGPSATADLLRHQGPVASWDDRGDRVAELFRTQFIAGVT